MYLIRLLKHRPRIVRFSTIHVANEPIPAIRNIMTGVIIRRLSRQKFTTTVSFLLQVGIQRIKSPIVYMAREYQAQVLGVGGPNK